MSVWRVTAAPAPGIAFADVDTFSTPLPDARGRIVQHLEGSRGTIHVIRLTGGPIEGTLHVTVYADGPGRRPFTLGGRAFTATPAGTTIALRVSEPTDARVALAVEPADSSSGLSIGPPWFGRAKG